MGYVPRTPFGRPVEAVHLQRTLVGDGTTAQGPVDKWAVLRALATARGDYLLSDRDLSVLQALLSFHPATDLRLGQGAGLVVHPSNRALCERLNGMPCSTMRRHMARLVAAGVLVRRDSPNGKRFARRFGGEKIVYGLDLSPLVARHTEIMGRAAAVLRHREVQSRMRETVSLMRRDLAGLAAYGRRTHPALTPWSQADDRASRVAKALRRTLTLAELHALEADLTAALCEARDQLETASANQLSANDARNEHHHQNSETESFDSERHHEEAPNISLDCLDRRSMNQL